MRQHVKMSTAIIHDDEQIRRELAKVVGSHNLLNVCGAYPNYKAYKNGVNPSDLNQGELVVLKK